MFADGEPLEAGQRVVLREALAGYEPGVWGRDAVE
jgi:hypothetical protein